MILTLNQVLLMSILLSFIGLIIVLIERRVTLAKCDKIIINTSIKKIKLMLDFITDKKGVQIDYLFLDLYTYTYEMYMSNMYSQILGAFDYTYLEEYFEILSSIFKKYKEDKNVSFDTFLMIPEIKRYRQL